MQNRTIPAVFIDANIPIYAGGREHRFREPCREILLLIPPNPAAFLTDVQVLQEMLHRYLSIRAWERGRDQFLDFAELMQERIEAVTADDALTAASLAERYPSLQAADLIHLAVMQRLGITRIVSADLSFDDIDGIERLDPLTLDV